jgi:hypothetical protein
MAPRARQVGLALVSAIGRFADLVAASAFGPGSKGKVRPKADIGDCAANSQPWNGHACSGVMFT